MSGKGFRRDDPVAEQERAAFLEQWAEEIDTTYLQAASMGARDAIVVVVDPDDAWSAEHAMLLVSPSQPEPRPPAGLGRLTLFVFSRDAAAQIAADTRLRSPARERFLNPLPGTFRVLAFAAGGIASGFRPIDRGRPVG